MLRNRREIISCINMTLNEKDVQVMGAVGHFRSSLSWYDNRDCGCLASKLYTYSYFIFTYDVLRISYVLDFRAEFRVL